MMSWSRSRARCGSVPVPAHHHCCRVLVLSLLVLLCSGPTPVRTSFQPALVLAMARVLLENYCFPENLQGMEEAIGQAVRSGQILSVSDRKTLASVLTTGVQGALNDPRLSVTFEPNYVAPATPPALSLLPREQLVRLVRSSMRLDVMEGGVGLLRLDRILGREAMARLGPAAMEQVWNRAARMRALILDLRHSVGGELSGVPFLVSFFSDGAEPPLLIESIYERPANQTRELWTMPRLPGLRFGKRKELMVLISRRTSGAAESLAYALKHLRRALVVGERSAGGSVRVEKIRIESSGFYIVVPVARATSAVTGQSWEVSGVTPSVAVRAKEALARARALMAARGVIPRAVQSVAELIERFYAARDKVKVLLEHLRNTDFFAVTSEEELAAKLNYELQSVCEDPRLVVKTTRESFPATITEEPELTDEVSSVPSGAELRMEDVFTVEVRHGNSGYLRIARLPDADTLARLEEEMVEKVWRPIKDTDHLVLDLRATVGGPSEGLPIILSYLHDPAPPLAPPIRFFTLYDSVLNTSREFHALPTHPGASYGSQRGVYVLTGSRTAAAGEELAYLMQSLHRGTVVGEITAGNLMHAQTFRAEGTVGILVTVPTVSFLDNAGESWLGGGVVPDAIVLAEEAEEAATEIVRFHAEVFGLVEGAGRVLESHYALPLVASRVRGELEQRWRDGGYRAVVDYESLASQLTSDLQESSGDQRIHVFYCDGEPEGAGRDAEGGLGLGLGMGREGGGMGEEEGEGGLTGATEQAGESSGGAGGPSSLVKVDVFPGGVGYLRVDMMSESGLMRALGGEGGVWSRLQDTSSLILDLRYNTAAGPASAVALLAGLFFPPSPPATPTHLYSVFDRASGNVTRVTTPSGGGVRDGIGGVRYYGDGDGRRVLVLAGHMTGAAGEALAKVLQQEGRARVVGEGSLGGALSSGMYQISNSILYAAVPNQAILSPANGEPWSLGGVEPDVPAQGADALAVARKILATPANPKQPQLQQQQESQMSDVTAFKQLTQDSKMSAAA